MGNTVPRLTLQYMQGGQTIFLSLRCSARKNGGKFQNLEMRLLAGYRNHLQDVLVVRGGFTMYQLFSNFCTGSFSFFSHFETAKNI